MTWNGLIQINSRGANSAAAICFLLIVVETLIDAPLVWNACRFAGRALRSMGD